MQIFKPDDLRELDAATAHWVCLLPATWMERPEWNRLRVRLSQSNRWFIVHGGNKSSAAVVEAMRDGAFDYIYTGEPVSRWRASVEKAAESQRLWIQLYGTRSEGSADLKRGMRFQLTSTQMTPAKETELRRKT